jgi:hypothetical protein
MAFKCWDSCTPDSDRWIRDADAWQWDFQLGIAIVGAGALLWLASMLIKANGSTHQRRRPYALVIPTGIAILLFGFWFGMLFQGGLFG